MRQLTLLLIVASVFPIGFAVEAAEQERCSALPTAAERIVCYDRQFPPDATPATTRDMHAVSPSEPVAEIPSQSPQVQSASVESQAPPPSSPADDREFGLPHSFDAAKRVPQESTIKAIHRRDQQAMIFLLANEQIWLQDSERALPFRVGDAVTIKSGTFGGYFLTNDDGTKTRVRRIK